MSSSTSTYQKNVRDLLDRALRDPAVFTEMSAADLDLTIRIARRVRLLGRLACQTMKRTLPHLAISGRPAVAVSCLDRYGREFSRS